MTLDWATGMLLAFAALDLMVAAAVLAIGRGPADRRIAALLAVFAGKSIPYIFGWRGHVEAPDWLALLPLNAPLALGPLLYTYAYARALSRAPRREWWHYAPALLEGGYCCTILLLPVGARHQWKETGHDHWIKPALEFAFVVSLATYAWLALRLLRDFRRRLVQERSDADRYTMRLLAAISAALLATALAYGAIFVYSNVVGEIDIGPYFFWLALLSIALALEGWRSAGRLTPVAFPIPAARERVVHDWSALGSDWRDRTQVAGWWREPELTLSELAKRLGVNSSYLSRGLNDGLNLNFNEFVNSLRAAEVARRLEDEDRGELLTLAFDAGFSSKATFNRAFRARFGISPSAYRQKLRASEGAHASAPEHTKDVGKS